MNSLSPTNDASAPQHARRARPGARVVVVLVAVLWALCVRDTSRAQGLVPVGELPPIVIVPYEIQVGDVLEVEFLKTATLSRTMTVGPDGEIFLPLVGSVGVLHRSIEEVTRTLIDQFSRQMVDPQITVRVGQYSGMLVYVGGEVNAPGMRSYRGGLTLVQAIVDAGGFSKAGKRREVLLIRKTPDHSAIGAIIDVKEILKGSHFDEDVLLAPSDVIYVPRKTIANVNLFIEQYLTNNIPFNLYLGYNVR